MRDFVVDYAPVGKGDTLTFHLTNRVLQYEETAAPPGFLESPIVFRVGSVGCDVRRKPEVDDKPRDWSDGQLPGNLVAQYAEGALGTAQATHVDAAGQEWWFVVFKAHVEPDWALWGGARQKLPTWLAGCRRMPVAERHSRTWSH